MPRALLTRALLAWLALIAVEFVHGILRTLYLAPILGDFRARQIGVFIGSALILLMAYLLVGWLRAPDTRALLQIGALWVALTLSFEFLFGHFAFGRSWASLAEDYDLRQGGLLSFGMIVLGLAPWIASRIYSRKSTHAA
jgi:hypothetical protein